MYSPLKLIRKYCILTEQIKLKKPSSRRDPTSLGYFTYYNQY